MRKTVVIGMGVLTVALVVAAIGLMPRKPRAGPWLLADGSELSLAGVTYGKKHTMRYGNAFANYFYPLLTPSLRTKLGCKAVSFNTANSNGIVLWFWDKLGQGGALNRALPYRVIVVDEHGMESESSGFPISTMLWRGTNYLGGWELEDFPRRSKEFTIRIYTMHTGLQLIGEFKIPNRTSRKYPIWTPQPLPMTVETNGLEVRLSLFETGLTDHEASPDGVATKTNYSSRAGFTLMENKKRAEADWRIESGLATSASGESRDSFAVWPFNPDHKELSYSLIYQGTLWTEEPAWKLRVKLSRSASFPQEELWTVKGLAIPGEGKKIEEGITTNIYGSELELMAFTGARVSYASVSYVADYSALHVRSPLPALDTRLELVEVKDDSGRNVEFREGSEVSGTGGRGATIRELRQSFLLTIPQGAKSLDATFAYTRDVFVEFVAKPTVAADNKKN